MSTATAPTQGGTGSPRNPVDRYFGITARGSTFAREIRGGVVTFFAMSYIIVLNPLIIGTVQDGSGQFLGGGDGPNLPMVAAATALIAGVMSILMGVIAKFPLALAAGLGLNAFVAFSVAVLPGMTWADAMGLVVLEGIIILLLVLTGFREAVFRAVPMELKLAISVGIGLFIALIGLFNAGLVRIPQSLATPLELGHQGSLTGWPTVVFIVGVLMIAALMVRKVRGAILIGIVVATVLALVVEAFGRLGLRSPENPQGWGLVEPRLPESVGDVAAVPDLGLLGQFSLLGSIQNIGVVAVVLLIFTLMIADFFDTMGTMVAVGTEADLLDEDGTPPHTRRILVVDSIGAAVGGMGSVSSNTSYIESAAGVGDGARTGLASVVTGALFLLATIFTPIVEMVPYEAATPALVIVGFLMLMQVTGISWKDYEIAIPAFLTIILMPFSYSIAVGIGAGFVSYVVLKLVAGKARQVHPLMYLSAVLFVVYFAIDSVEGLLETIGLLG